MTKAPKTPKKPKKFNANSATLKWLESLGFTAELVESRIPTTWITRDLFGCIDIIAMRCDPGGIYGIQATSGGGNKGQSNGLARRRKLLGNEKAKLFIQCGGKLWLVVWHPPTPHPFTTELTLEDFK